MLLIPPGLLCGTHQGLAGSPPPSLGPVWSSAKHSLSEGGRAMGSKSETT